ncbi:MAG TPA: hypothetical protein VGF56_02200 [Rhizomicrobium sp.]|jgi:hypothetical protein
MDDYNEKPTPNVRASDVLGILGCIAIAFLTVYLLVMFFIHMFAGRTPG